MRGQYKQANRMFHHICVTIMLTMMLIMGHAMAASAADPQAVSAANKHKVSGGTFVAASKGIRYKQKNGKYLSGCWAKIDQDVYYFTAKGYAARGEFTWKRTKYRADAKGRLLIDQFYMIKGKSTGKTKGKAIKEIQYFGLTGAMAKCGWKTAQGKLYYFDKHGYMARNEWVGLYYLDGNGQKKKDCFVDGHYINKSGKRVDQLSTKELKQQAQMEKTKMKLIIIGASRVCHMAEDVTGDEQVIYFARGGRGYSWMMSSVYKPLCRYLSVYPQSTVVFQMGNNDITAHKKKDGNINQYTKVWKQLMKAYPKVSFYFMDALPSADPKNPYNPYRVKFNRELKKRFPRQSIGGYDYMNNVGYTTRNEKDLAHYSPQTNRMLYEYILKKTGWTW